MSGTRSHRPGLDGASAQNDLICAPQPMIIDQTQAPRSAATGAVGRPSFSYAALRELRSAGVWVPETVSPMRPGQICGLGRQAAALRAPRQGPAWPRYLGYTTGPAAAHPAAASSWPLLPGTFPALPAGITNRARHPGRLRAPSPVHFRLSGLDLYVFSARSVLARMRRYGPAGAGTHVTLPREVAVQLRTS